MNIYDRAFSDKHYSSKEPYKIKIVQDWAEDKKRLLDVGCGRGYYLTEIKATGLEPSKYLCETDLQSFDVINSDILSLKTRRKWDGLYCMDVLEHIPHQEINKTIEALSKLAPEAIYGIANHSDIYDGVELHLIQEDSDWWESRLSKYYSKVELTYHPLRYFVFECSR